MVDLLKISGCQNERKYESLYVSLCYEDRREQRGVFLFCFCFFASIDSTSEEKKNYINSLNNFLKKIAQLLFLSIGFLSFFFSKCITQTK